jgi:hypothetical protein
METPFHKVTVGLEEEGSCQCRDRRHAQYPAEKRTSYRFFKQPTRRKQTRPGGTAISWNEEPLFELTDSAARHTCPDRDRGAERQSSRIERSSLRMRAGSAITSISTIFSPVTLKANTKINRPRGARTIPTSPFTSACCANRARRL